MGVEKCLPKCQGRFNLKENKKEREGDIADIYIFYIYEYIHYTIYMYKEKERDFILLAD